MMTPQDPWPLAIVSGLVMLTFIAALKLLS